MNIKETAQIIALAIIVSLTIGSPAVLGQTDEQSGNDLVGVWEAVGVPAETDCKTDAPVGPLINIAYTFNERGTMYVEDTLSVDRYRTTGSGIWKRNSGRNYSYKFFHYGFDAAGKFTYTVKGTSELTLSRDGNSLTERGRFDIVFPDGTVIYSGCFVGTSNRMTF